MPEELIGTFLIVVGIIGVPVAILISMLWKADKAEFDAHHPNWDNEPHKTIAQIEAEHKAKRK